MAFIHTHPYKDGDTVSDSNCPRVQEHGPFQYDGNVVSDGDEALMNSMNAAGFNIPIYVIDKGKIRVIQPSNTSQYTQTFNRCGY